MILNTDSKTHIRNFKLCHQDYINILM